jgi:uncharacterized membrane protein YedE/YeeE
MASIFSTFSQPLLGGALIGAAASLLLLVNRETAGISGVVAALMRKGLGSQGWRLAFLGGLLAGGVGLALFAPARFSQATTSLPLVALAGVLVGLGTRMGGGCTSGHGVCGTSRLSVASIAATVIFVAVGMITVTVIRLTTGAGL